MANSYGFSTALIQQQTLELPLTSKVGPSEVLVLTTETLLVNLTGAIGQGGVTVIHNKGAASIFLALHTSGAAGPGVTTANGVELTAGATYFLDRIGGLAVWAIAAADQVAGSGTRVAAGYR